jgi:TolB protein
MTPRLFTLCRAGLLHLLVATLVLASTAAQAQFRVEVSGIGMTQVPIALAPFRGEDASPQKIAAIVQADLERSGQFRSVDASGPAMDEITRPDLTVWRQRSADALAAGSVTRLAAKTLADRVMRW